ncbi:MAG: hypothetical protein IPP74_06265 [Alphaproteobacteria bacterium]|nr:hypothetical protein [Alphaproteobacteria bacterium]
MEITGQQLVPNLTTVLGQRLVPVLPLSVLMNQIPKGTHLNAVLTPNPAQSQTIAQTVKGDFLLPYAIAQKAVANIQWVENSPLVRVRLSPLNFDPATINHVEQSIEAEINAKPAASPLLQTPSYTTEVTLRSFQPKATDPLQAQPGLPIDDFILGVDVGSVSDDSVPPANAGDLKGYRLHAQVLSLEEMSTTTAPQQVIAQLKDVNVDIIESWLEATISDKHHEQLIPELNINKSLAHGLPKAGLEFLFAGNMKAELSIQPYPSNVFLGAGAEETDSTFVLENPLKQHPDAMVFSIRTTVGTLVIPANAFPQDEEIILSITAISPPVSQAFDAMMEHLPLGNNGDVRWMLFERLLEALSSLPSTAETKSEKGGHLKLSSASITSSTQFLQAIVSGSLDDFLTTEQKSHLRLNGHAELYDKLHQEFHAVKMVYDHSLLSRDWQTLLFPWQQGNEVLQLPMFMKTYPEKRKNSESAEDEGKKQRFVVNAHVQDLGKIQFDGLISGDENQKRLELIIRSESEISSAMQQDIKVIFDQQLVSSHLRGDIRFNRVTSLVENPLIEQAEFHRAIQHMDIIA